MYRQLTTHSASREVVGQPSSSHKANLAPSSKGQDCGLSIRKLEFKSPRGHIESAATKHRQSGYGRPAETCGIVDECGGIQYKPTFRSTESTGQTAPAGPLSKTPRAQTNAWYEKRENGPIVYMVRMRDSQSHEPGSIPGRATVKL